MSKSRRLSSASAQCPPLRIEWRPSGHVTAALALLSLLAPFSLVVSGVPTPWALMLAVPVLLAGARMVHRYACCRPMALVIPAGLIPATRDGMPVEAFEVQWRGPLAFARWTEGGDRRRVAFFADTLDAASRRALKLAMQRRQVATEPLGLG